MIIFHSCFTIIHSALYDKSCINYIIEIIKKLTCLIIHRHSINIFEFDFSCLGKLYVVSLNKWIVSKYRILVETFFTNLSSKV